MRWRWAILAGCLVSLGVNGGWAEDNAASAPDSNGIRWQEAKPGQKLLLSHDQIVRMKAVMAQEEAELKPLRDQQAELQRQSKARQASFGQPLNQAQAQQQLALMHRDSTLQDLQAQMRAIVRQMTAVRSNYSTQKEAILTPVQLAAYQVRKEKSRQEQEAKYAKRRAQALQKKNSPQNTPPTPPAP